MRLTLAASAACTRVSFFRRRMRLAAFVPSRCRLPECMRSSLPVAVTLKRLAAPRCVFSFCFFAIPGILSRLILRRGGPASAALLRRKQCHEDVALHARRSFDLAVLGDFAEQA